MTKLEKVKDTAGTVGNLLTIGVVVCIIILTLVCKLTYLLVVNK